MTPITLVCGPAGSGKSSFSDYLAKYLDGVCIAQADPLKSLAMQVFDFSEEKLWGPSHERNTPNTVKLDWGEACTNYVVAWEKWIREILPKHLKDFMDGMPKVSLNRWFGDLEKFYLNQENHNPIPRRVLQSLGDWGRNLDLDIWSTLALNTSTRLLGGGVSYDRTVGLKCSETAKLPHHVIITDGRLPNELINAKKVGATLIKIVTPEVNKTVNEAGIQGHCSETDLNAIPDHWFDHIITNHKSRGLPALENLAYSIATETRRHTVRHTI